MIRSKKIIGIFLVLLVFLNCQLSAQKAEITIYSRDILNEVSPFLTGACIEDVNHEIYGGLYSQMIFGESFQEPALKTAEEGSVNDPAQSYSGAISRMWGFVREGTADGYFAFDTINPFLGRQSQRMVFVSGKGEIGIENRSLNRWGMCFRKGNEYEGYIWLRSDKPEKAYLSLENSDGSVVYCEQLIKVVPGDWKKVGFRMIPDRNDTGGRFSIRLKQPGGIEIGYVFLQPGEWGRFKGLPVRKDIAEALISQRLTVLRYGGSMVSNAHGGYLWKRMIGPRDLRQPYNGTWYPWSTNGWGIIDFIDFCEAAGFMAIPDFSMNETPQDIADFVEYVNGSADSKWGKKRAVDGHPAPYRIKYIELGNEEAVNDDYWNRFKPMAEAIWSKSPDIKIVVGDFLYSEPIHDPFSFSGAPHIKSLEAHQKILELAKKYDREVLFDVHIDTDRPENWRGLKGVPSFIDALGKICPGAKYSVVIFEFNANHHDMGRALGNARAINEIERSGDEIFIACSANCLQPYKQNDNGWNQGLLFFTPSQVWGQPPYYVTQMASEYYLPECVKAESQSPDNALDVTALRSKNGKIIQLQVVNLKDKPVQTQIKLKDFIPSKPEADVFILKSNAIDNLNTPDNSRIVVPCKTTFKYTSSNGNVSYIFQPYSYTIVRFE